MFVSAPLQTCLSRLERRRNDHAAKSPYKSSLLLARLVYSLDGTFKQTPANLWVTENTIVKMTSLLEPPDPNTHNWEKNSFVVLSQQDLSEFDQQQSGWAQESWLVQNLPIGELIMSFYDAVSPEPPDPLLLLRAKVDLLTTHFLVLFAIFCFRYLGGKHETKPQKCKAPERYFDAQNHFKRH